MPIWLFLTIGKIHTLKPDVESPIELHLTRKYPLNLEKLLRIESLVGMVIEGSNRKDMQDADTLHVIQKEEYKPFYSEVLKKPSSYRYYRISLPGFPVLTLAELAFYDSLQNRLYPKSVIKDGEYTRLDMPGKNEIRHALDGDYLSHANIKEASSGIILDFGQTAPEVSVMKFMPRNDENYVYPGNCYELFYHDANGWVSLGKKNATDYFIIYENVPAGALYWLRNLTKGKEERVFTYENGNIRFW